MARTLSFSGELTWPMEDGKQAAKLPLVLSLPYVSVVHVEKVYAAPVADEAIDLPMATAKFLLIQATGEDITVKINGAASGIAVKAVTGFMLIWNEDGAITDVTVTITGVPATLKAYIFS